MNKKILLFCTILLLYSQLYAQFTVNNTQGYVKLTDAEYNLDALILLNGIDASTYIEYTGSEEIEWRYELEGSEYNSTQKDISPETKTLYTIYIISKINFQHFANFCSLYIFSLSVYESTTSLGSKLYSIF